MTAVLLDSIVVSEKVGYLFNPKQETMGLTKIDISSVTGMHNNISAAYSDPVTDNLYMVHSGNKLIQWNVSSTLLQYTWTSKFFQMPYPANLLAGQVRGDSFGSGITLNLYSEASTTPYFTRTVTADGEFVCGTLGGLTQGAKYFQCEVIGTANIKWLEFAEDMEELS